MRPGRPRAGSGRPAQGPLDGGTQRHDEFLSQGGQVRGQPGDGMGRARRAHRGHARERLRQGRAQGDDRAQAPQRLRPQARVRHAAQGAPRGPVGRAARRPRRLVAHRRFAAAHLRPAGAPGRRRQGQDRRDRAADGGRRLRQHAAPRARVLQRPDPAGADGPARRAPCARARAGRAARRPGRGFRHPGAGRRRTAATAAGLARRLGRADPPRHAAGRGLRQGVLGAATPRSPTTPISTRR